jgi:hypothetical protein
MLMPGTAKTPEDPIVILGATNRVRAEEVIVLLTAVNEFDCAAEVMLIDVAAPVID